MTKYNKSCKKDLLTDLNLLNLKKVNTKKTT